MRNLTVIGVIFASVSLSISWGETARRPLFVCLEMPTDANEITSESLVKIERALNMSGAFLTTHVTTPHRLESPPDPSPNEVPPFNAPETSIDDARPGSPRIPPAPPAISTGRRQTYRGSFPGDTLASRSTSVISERDPPLDTRTPLQREIHPGDLELLFQRTLVTVCRSVFPDIFSRNPHSTPFRHQNCSVLCVYGSPPVEIPEGGMCYQQRNFVGTPGRCRNGHCVISGRPFEFSFEEDGPSNPYSRPPFAPGFTPDVHTPRRGPRYPPRRR